MWLVPFFFLSFVLRPAASQNHPASLRFWKAMNLNIFSRLTVSGSQSCRTMREVNQIPVMVLTCGRGQGLWLQGAQTGPSGRLGGVSVGGGKGRGLQRIRRLALYFQSSDCVSTFIGIIRQKCNKLWCAEETRTETRDQRKRFAILDFVLTISKKK